MGGYTFAVQTKILSEAGSPFDRLRVNSGAVFSHPDAVAPASVIIAGETDLVKPFPEIKRLRGLVEFLDDQGDVTVR